ncbi:MAG: dicarboxylate/amino acid:cation symporter [Pseudomonadota bacterium]
MASSMEQASTPSLWRQYRDLSLGVKILVWMALGIALGALLPEWGLVLRPVGDLFIRLLLMAAIPLVFFNLVAGITSLSDISILGKLGVQTFVYYLATTAMALAVGLVIATYFMPGLGFTLTEQVADDIGAVPSVGNIILSLFPENIFKAFVDGNVAQVVVFAIFVGVATLMLPAKPKEDLQGLFAMIAELLRQIVTIILIFAPIGVGALAAATVGEYGPSVFGPMAKFVGTVWFAQTLMVIFYMSLLLFLSRRNPVEWLRQTGSVFATTAATCSSLASLVVAMDVAKRKLGLSERVFTFTLPLGAQLNKDGTAIMLAVVLLFTAQAAGIDFSLVQLLTILLVGLLLSEGSGGIPGGGMVIALIFVKAFNLPLEIAGIVAGIYRLIDMGSTTINVMGDMTWSTILHDREARKLHASSPDQQ